MTMECSTCTRSDHHDIDLYERVRVVTSSDFCYQESFIDEHRRIIINQLIPISRALLICLLNHPPQPMSPADASESPSPAILPRRPRPRARSPASTARTQTRNRRKQYLDTHPEYFQSPHLESARSVSLSFLPSTHSHFPAASPAPQQQQKYQSGDSPK